MWDVGTPRVTLARPLTVHEQPEFLSRLKEAIEAAAERKAHTLVRCRYCSTLIPPEHASDTNTCHACASRVLSIVF